MAKEIQQQEPTLEQAQELFNLLNTKDSVKREELLAVSGPLSKKENTAKILQSEAFAQVVCQQGLDFISKNPGLSYDPEQGRLTGADGNTPENPVTTVFKTLNHIQENSPSLLGNVDFEQKKPSSVLASNALTYYNGHPNEFSDQRNKLLPEGEQQDGKLPEGEDNRKTLTLEQLRDRLYRGTLTAEQAEQLKKEDDKKVADLDHQDGDVQKSPKREHSGDKFRDEDIVKYMYENWFLGGMSWVCNKTEDFLLNTLDSAFDGYRERMSKSSKATEKRNQEALEEVSKQVAQFTNATSKNMDNSRKLYEQKGNSYNAIYDELTRNMNNPDFPNVEWTHFDPKKNAGDRDFIEQLNNDPNRENKIKSMRLQTADTLMTLATTDNLAQLITGLEMTEDVMRHKKAWDGSNKQYKDTATLLAEHQQRSQTRQEQLMEAINVVAEQARLKATQEYQKLTDQQKAQISESEYTRQKVSTDCGQFIGTIAKEAKNANGIQNKNINENRYDVIDKKPNKDVTKSLKKINEAIQNKINEGKALDDASISRIQQGVEISKRTKEMTLLTQAKQDNQAVAGGQQAVANVDAQLEEVHAKQTKNKTRKREFLEAIAQKKQELAQKLGRNKQNTSTNTSTTQTSQTSVGTQRNTGRD